MEANREPRYRSPYDDGSSPLALALAGLVLVVILLVAGWLMIPCQWFPGLKECGAGPGPDRYALQSAIRASCNSEQAISQRDADGIDLDCWCVASRLAPSTPTATQPGLSREGLIALQGALVDNPQQIAFNRLEEVLGFDDAALFRTTITRSREEGGCTFPIAAPSDEYPASPWPVINGCAQVQYRGDDAQDSASWQRNSHVSIQLDPYGRSGDWVCLPRETASRLYADGARYWMLRGDAELARHDVQCLAEMGSSAGGQPAACTGGWRGGVYFLNGRARATALETAMRYWHQASDWGRPFGAQASIMAQRRLQAHMVQCLSSADGTSLARLAHGGPGGHGEAVLLSLRQRALAALGYYAGPIDGQYTADTREATRGFQRELGYDETGTLTPRQTTLLICHAAQTARDAEVQNALGIMYALGLGVEDNIDLSLEWLETAARRNDRDAYLNLALIYGTGRVLESYRLCGVSENFEQADAYLREAARLRHPRALQWCNTLGCAPGQLSPADRWRRINEMLEQEGWPTHNYLDPQPAGLPDTCLHAETRHGSGPPR